MRTALFIIASIFVLNVFPKTSIAQESNKECEELKKEVLDLQAELEMENKALQSFEEAHNRAIQDYQKALEAYKRVIKNSVTGEDLRSEILEDLRKITEIQKDLSNAIESMKKSIEETKDRIKDLLNKLANCGNKNMDEPTKQFNDCLQSAGAERNLTDPNRAHNSKTGQNFVWDEKKKSWIDTKTGECICPKCDETKKEHAMKEKTSPSNFLTGNTGNFEVCGGVGYGFSFNGGLLGQNRTFTATDRTFDGVYGSWAQGENFFIKIDYKVSNCFNVGTEFDYTYGKNITWDQNTIGATSTTDQHYEGRYTGYSATPFIQFNPCGSNRFSPYVDLGLRLNFSNSIKQNYTQTQTNNNNTTTTIQKITLKGAFSPGFDAALGAKYSLSNRLALLAELYSSNSNFIQDEATLDNYTINGVDQLGTLNTSQKKIDYVKRFTVPTSGTDPNKPSQALRSSQPASTIGMRLGIDLKF